MDDPKCENPGSILKFRASMNMTVNNGTMAPSRTDSLTIEANSDGVKSANGILLLLVTKSANQAMLEALEKVWDDTIGDKWSNLKISHLRDYLTGLPTYGSEGPIQLVHSVVCSPNYWNDLAGKRSLICVDGICTEETCESNEGIKRSLEKRYGGARDYTAKLNDGTDAYTVVITLPRVSIESSHRVRTTIDEINAGNQKLTYL
jgi:hypothetical protein